MGGNDLMDKFTFHPLPKNMLCNILLTKFFPDPVQPLKESAKAFLDCKTVRIFAYARFARVRLVRHALPISLLILTKKPTVLQSILFHVAYVFHFRPSAQLYNNHCLLMLLTSNSISDKATPAIRDLITLRSSKNNL